MNIQFLLRLIRDRLRWRLPHRDARANATEHLSAWLLEPRTAAEVRAKQLLLRILSPTQRAEFERHGFFSVVVAGRGKFCILATSIFNVLEMQSGCSYCARVQARVPLPDLLLAQKLVLENDPQAFFKVANHRAELPHGAVQEPLALQQILEARRRLPRRSPWSELSMIPHATYLP